MKKQAWSGAELGKPERKSSENADVVEMTPVEAMSDTKPVSRGSRQSQSSSPTKPRVLPSLENPPDSPFQNLSHIARPLPSLPNNPPLAVSDTTTQSDAASESTSLPPDPNMLYKFFVNNIKEGNTKQLKQFLSLQPKDQNLVREVLKVKDDTPGVNKGSTLLHHAARDGDQELVAELLLAATRVNANGGSSSTAFADATDDIGSTALHYAAAHTDLNAAQALRVVGGAIEIVNKAGERPQDVAKKSGHSMDDENIRKLLINIPKDIETIGHNKKTPGSPLARGVASVRRNITKLIDALELSPKIADTEHTISSPFAMRIYQELAVLIGRRDDSKVSKIQSSLSKFDINTINDQGETLLHKAARAGSPTMVEFLLKNGADIKAVDNDYNTPLHKSVENNDESVTQTLIKNGASLRAKNRFHNNPLAHAAALGKSDRVEVLATEDHGNSVPARELDNLIKQSIIDNDFDATKATMSHVAQYMSNKGFNIEQWTGDIRKALDTTKYTSEQRQEILEAAGLQSRLDKVFSTIVDATSAGFKKVSTFVSAGSSNTVSLMSQSSSSASSPRSSDFGSPIMSPVSRDGGDEDVATVVRAASKSRNSNSRSQGSPRPNNFGVEHFRETATAKGSASASPARTPIRLISEGPNSRSA